MLQQNASIMTPSILFTPLSIRLFARPPATRSVNGNDLINDEIMFVMEPRSRSVPQTNGTECRIRPCGVIRIHVP